MQTLERGSSWSGLAITVCISGLLAGCAQWPLAPDATRQYLAFASQVRSATPAERTDLWRAVGTERTDGTRLRRAILQSYPGHPGHNPTAAMTALDDLVHDGSADVAVIAELRLDELRSSSACEAEVAELKKRLGKVADIERDATSKGDN